MAVQGERTLWHSGSKTGATSPHSPASSQRTSSQPGGAVPGPMQSRVGALPSASTSAAPAKTKVIGPHNPIRQTLRALGAFAAHSGTTDAADRGTGLSRARRSETSGLVDPDQVKVYPIPVTCMQCGIALHPQGLPSISGAGGSAGWHPVHQPLARGCPGHHAVGRDGGSRGATGRGGEGSCGQAQRVGENGGHRQSRGGEREDGFRLERSASLCPPEDWRGDRIRRSHSAQDFRPPVPSWPTWVASRGGPGGCTKEWGRMHEGKRTYNATPFHILPYRVETTLLSLRQAWSNKGHYASRSFCSGPTSLKFCGAPSIG